MHASLASGARETSVATGALELDCGETLPAVEQRVTVYGSPALGAPSKRVVLVCHALTGSGRAAAWWPGIVGDGALFDPSRWCVIGVNALGSCYGSTGPASYGPDFPRITVRDIVRAQARALDELGFGRIDVVVGGSLGGMQALQWALLAPERIRRALIVGAHDHHSAFGIALNAVQRDCLRLDPVRGLRTARKIAILTYKSDELLRERHDRRPDRSGTDRYDVEGYLDDQADRFEGRMDAATYETLTHAMDAFDVRDTPPACAPCPSLQFVGISSDRLFRAQDVRDAAARFARLGYDATYREFPSDHGHDAFLAEDTALAAFLHPA